MLPRALLILSLLLASGECLAQASDHDAAAIDKIWQEANRKYDRARGALVQTVDRQATSGPFRPDWATPEEVSRASVVREREVRHLHSLGRLFGPGVRQRVVFAQHVSCEGSPEYEHHVATYGPQTKFGYKDFIPKFTAENFDPAALGQPVSRGRRAVRHAGGRAPRWLPDVRLELSDWNAAKMGPKRDMVGELAAAVRRRGCTSGLPATAPSTGGSSTAGMSSTPT